MGGKTSSGYGRLKLGRPLPRLAVGAMLRATVAEQRRNGDVGLMLREPLLLGLPRHKEADIRIPREAVGNYAFKAGQKRDVIVTEVVEDEAAILAFCRRLTHEEQQAAGAGSARPDLIEKASTHYTHFNIPSRNLRNL